LPNPSNVKYAGIPDPSADPNVMIGTVRALKENVELLTGQRPGALPPVTWPDLVRLGLIQPGDVPR